MANILKPLGLAALIALGAPAMAQDTAEAPELDMGSTAEAPAQGDVAIETYIDGAFDSWQRECLRNPGGEDPCQITQILRENPEDLESSPVGKISIGRLPDGQEAAAGSMIVMPLGTLLTQQLTLAVDSAAAKRYPFRFCDQIGCVSQVGFTNAEVGSFKAGNQATITITPAIAPDATVAIDVSLKGFTAAWDSLTTPGSGAEAPAEDAPAEDTPAEEAPAE